MSPFRRLLCCASLFLASCGEKGHAPLAPVRGHVSYQGKPLVSGTVVFTPDAQRGGCGPQAWAKIGPDGSFELSTAGVTGATPGWHRVTVAGASVPARYHDPDRSEQAFEVHLDAANVCELRLP